MVNCEPPLRIGNRYVVLSPAVISAAVCMVLFAVLACGTPADEQMHSLGPENGEHSLLVVFREGTPDQEVFRVVTERLSQLRDRNTGAFSSLPGERSMVKQEVHGHVAYLVAFTKTSTTEQRSLLTSRVTTEPSVLAVFHDVLPSQIGPKDLPDAK